MHTLHHLKDAPPEETLRYDGHTGAAFTYFLMNNTNLLLSRRPCAMEITNPPTPICVIKYEQLKKHPCLKSGILLVVKNTTRVSMKKYVLTGYA